MTMIFRAEGELYMYAFCYLGGKFRELHCLEMPLSDVFKMIIINLSKNIISKIYLDICFIKYEFELIF